jgi:signal transduction histidine kinase
VFIYSTIISKSIDNYELIEGTIHRASPEITTKPRIQQLIKKRDAGWKQDEIGFWSYHFNDKEENLIIFPGLVIDQYPSPKKIFDKNLPKFKKTDIENYAAGIIQYSERIRSQADEEINLLVHDLRNISSSIYNNALEAKNSLSNNENRVLDLIDSVIAAQAMLKMRTDLIDFLGNPNSISGIEKIPVYRRFDKVVKTFNIRARTQKIAISMTGNSFNFVDGPDILELVPYIIIDNAIKYSPPDTTVNITFSDKYRETEIAISSFGPKIEENEKFDIFSRGVRGINAMDSAKAGSGIGLALAKKIIEDQFDGVITVSQSGVSVKHENSDYFHTTFTLLMPSHNPDEG